MLQLRNLRIEYQENPMGIDIKNPRFSWILESNEKDTIQKAYHIIVTKGNELFWDTKKLMSEQSVHIVYGGTALEPFSEYLVQVVVYDNHGNEAEVIGKFETGMFESENFHGEWITHCLEEETDACPVFFKNFQLKGTVKSARIYASALGIYELTLNDEKVGDTYFAPGWTAYEKRVQYQTYDITQQLKEENKLEITVANGWYKGIFGFTCTPNNYGDTVAAIAEIRITYENGIVERIGTDEHWNCTTGITRYSEIYMGETIDHTMKQQELAKVRLFEYPKSVLVAQECEPVRITERLKAIKKIVTPKGELVLDFGQNMTGFVECKVNQKEGTQITLKHAEVLDKEGNFYTENLRGAEATDRFICSGKEEIFRPRFTFHGFRYLCIDGLHEDISPDDFTACVLHTDMAPTGEFSCSHEGVTKLQKNIQWGQRGNFLDIPTDCNQRDERLGWTGDAQVFARTSAYNYNVALFFTKWLHDLKAEQTKEYGVSHVVPNILGLQEGAAAWGDAATIIPWTMYLVYGDTKILEEQYESMKEWVEFIRSRAGDSHLWQTGFQYGDWVALDKEEGSDRVGATDVYLIASAFYAYSTDIVAKTADILGFEEDSKIYSELYHKIKEKFNEEYITKTGRMVSETQTACVLALHFDLVKEGYRNRILNALINNLGKHKNHLVTGFVGTPYLCHALSENGQQELAGKLLLQDDYPSWLYSVKMGGTTIWERWNSMLPDGSFDESGMNSFNHYAYGSVGDWMYQRLSGLQIVEPGYKKSRIAPEFIKGINYAKGKVETIYGTLACEWSCKDKKITVDIRVPANTTAIIKLPEREDEFLVGSGIYHYSYNTETVLEIDKYSMESTLGQILAEPLAVEMLEQMSPGMSTNPMIKFAYDQSISELIFRMPAGGEQMFQMVIDKLNAVNK